MNAKQIIREHLDAVNQSKIIGIFMADQETLQSEMELVACDIARFSANPPEPPKTILPDMSNAEYGKYYLFLAQNGQKVAYWRTAPQDTACWRLNETNEWLSAVRFMEAHPHLGRLHTATHRGGVID